MIEEHDHGPVRTLRLARPPVNALDRGLMQALEAAVVRAPGQGVRGLVLTGAGGRYCAGLDVQQIVALDAAGLREFLATFYSCLAKLAESPIPIAAAINGHSPAGGAVLALYCDRRIMAAGDYRIGLNEVQVGLCPGETIFAVLALTVGHRVAAELLPSGALIEAAEALRLGFVDELAPLAEVEGRARAWLEAKLALPPEAYRATRAIARAALIGLHRDPAARIEAAVGAWQSQETRRTLKALLERLARK